ncbi:MAG: DNA polymerase III subunit gamma/tau, partial [Planctomycetes bacterium]|nr:DNA polymerase III subunit gamma/tau [Planctomycetota bacterium]
MYEAMARRYRPNTFDEVIGQEHVAQTLRNAISSERVAHAYLFCGPHGCGKTSMARIFAKAMVCEQGPTTTPCNTCDFCKDIMRGVDVDVQEIDGASNNSVEQVRSLREHAGYIPTRARFKIYIIDEVHMLSTAAFNALLKTLEEPPAHVKFILATTDPHKVPDTVLSRCQRFDFRLVPPPVLASFFKGLVGKEQAQIADDAVEAVAAFSGGSVRDGLVLLDQLLSYAQGEVTREDVERVRGVASAESVAGLYDSICKHDIKTALSIVDGVASCGTNVGDFLDQLIDFGRDLMLIVATGKDDGISAYGPARETILTLGRSLSLDHVLLMLDVFTQARTRVRSRALTNPLVPLEMAVARLAGLENLEPVGAGIQKLDALARGA